MVQPDHSHDDDKTQTHVVLTVGAMVSHYRIVEKIGAGGMGEVYLAEDTELDRKVALKFLPSHLCQDDDCRARFKREAQAVAKLNHPNIVTIFEVAEHNSQSFFAMELVEGQSLRDLAKGKELGIDRIIELAIQICDGLSAAHDKSVVHRDIKPSNIVIDAYGRPKILDFGLAAIQGSEHLTKTGSTLGTVRYMSPEQVQGQEVDHRSDLFSLGVVLYELLAGRTPFEKENEAATLKAITQDSPEPLARYKSDIPDELQRTVSKLLEKDPSMRYQVAAGVTSDLKRLIAPTQSSISVSPVKARNRWPLWAGVGVVALVLVAVFGWQFLQTDQEPVEPEGRIMLAVLPFENLGSPEDEYFADGLTEEITSKLGVVGKLGVISRTSAMLYKNTDKGLPEIAVELGVDYIIEGTVRWDKTGDTSMVRITPQLIRVSDNTHLWADNYERPLTGIFSIQADIAERVVEKLDIALLEPARRLIEDRPTENMQAYEYLLRGHEYRLRSFEEEDCRIALEMYQSAVELDSTFAEAYAWLGYSHLTLYWWPYFRADTTDRLKMARTAIDKALDLEPNLPEGHSAFAVYYYWGFLDYENALKEMARVREIRPYDSWDYHMLGAMKRRSGKWEEAILSYEQSAELSPRNGSILLELPITHHMMRHYKEAERLYDISTSLTPELTWAYLFESEMFLMQGDVEAARRVLNRAVGKVENTSLIHPMAECDIMDRDYESALDRLVDMTIPLVGDSSWYYLKKAMIFHLMSDSSASIACYDSARIYLEHHYRPVTSHDYDDVFLAWAYAGLGMKELAISEMSKAAARIPLNKDAFEGAFMLYQNAITNVLIGDYEKALDLIDTLLSIPSHLSVPALRLHPQWDPIRDHPRFQALIEKYEKEHGR